MVLVKNYLPVFEYRVKKNESILDLLARGFEVSNTNELKALKLSSSGKKALEPLLHLVSSLEKAGYGDYMTIDLSELPDLDYYNGIVFNVYAAGAEMPLVSGGRYDLLFKELGQEKSAVGSAIGFIRWKKYFTINWNSIIAART